MFVFEFVFEFVAIAIRQRPNATKIVSIRSINPRLFFRDPFVDEKTTADPTQTSVQKTL